MDRQIGKILLHAGPWSLFLFGMIFWGWSVCDWIGTTGTDCQTGSYVSTGVAGSMEGYNNGPSHSFLEGTSSDAFQVNELHSLV